MKTPECGNCAGCPGAANCPSIASRREKVSVISTLSVVAEKPLITGGVSKIINFQTYRNFSGGPVSEVRTATCNDCKDGPCSKHLKAA